MHERVLKRVQKKTRAGQYVVTLHAEEEMDDDGLTVYDMEAAILAGEIVERQRDRETGEQKYLVQGRIAAGKEIVVVVKLGITGKVVIITVYRV